MKLYINTINLFIKILLISFLFLEFYDIILNLIFNYYYIKIKNHLTFIYL